MKKKHPTVDDQSVIDAQATSLLGGWLAAGWVVRPQKPDYHVDYIIESVNGGELSGAKFCAQQKGHREVRFSGPFAREQMKAKHLLYYSERERLPVFLFVIDVTARRGYYLFMQEWLDMHVPPGALRQRAENGGKWSVDVPQANDIENAVALAAEVERAFAYMKKKYPGTVEDAVAHDIDAMSAVDPRFGFSLNIVEGKKHYRINPKQDVEMSLEVTGVNVGCFSEFRDYGKPLELSGEGVKIVGSPLFENREIASLRIKPVTTKADLHIWTDGERGFRHAVPVTISGGRAGLAFVANLEEAPFRMEMKLPNPVPGQIPGPGVLSVGWPFENWREVHVAKLPYFDFIYSLSMAILADEVIHHELVFRGNRVTCGTFGKPADDKPFTRAALLVDHAKKLRSIGAKTGIPFNFPSLERLDWQAVTALELAHALIVDGQYKGNGSKFSTDAVISVNDEMNMAPELFLEELTKMAADIGYEFEVPDRETTVQGKRIALGKVMYSVAPAKIELNEPSRSDFLASKTRSISVKISGVENSEMHIRVVDRTP